MAVEKVRNLNEEQAQSEADARRNEPVTDETENDGPLRDTEVREGEGEDLTPEHQPVVGEGEEGAEGEGEGEGEVTPEPEPANIRLVTAGIPMSSDGPVNIGMVTVNLPDEETQRAGFYLPETELSLLIQHFPRNYKRIVAKDNREVKRVVGRDNREVKRG